MGKTPILNISKGIKPDVLKQLDSLPCFTGVTDERLFQIAEGKLKHRRTVVCRVTAMLIIVGDTPLDDAVFQIPPEPTTRNFA